MSTAATAAKALVVAVVVGVLFTVFLGIPKTTSQQQQRTGDEEAPAARSLLLTSSGQRALPRRSPRALSLKTLPPETTPAAELFEYWSGIGRLVRSEAPAARDSDSLLLDTVPVSDALSWMEPDPTGVPPQLQGVWWWSDHPTFGNVLFSFYGGSTRPDGAFDGNDGVTTGEYVYMSLVKAGAVLLPDTAANRSQLSWFASYQLEMAFPEFNSSLAEGQGTFVNTHMSFPYHQYPLPAAIAEGWDWRNELAWSLNRTKSADAAHCYCSLYYTTTDTIERHNFGKFAYFGFRVLDENSQPTSHWSHFLSTMNARGVTSLVGRKAAPAITSVRLSTARVSSSSSSAAATAPDHPVISLLFNKVFRSQMRYSVNGEAVATGVGKFSTTYGGVFHPTDLIAGVDMNITMLDGTSRQTTWIGWNNVLLDSVTRYLITQPFDVDGSPGEKVCSQYPDQNPSGYYDPILLMSARYQLVGSSGSVATYRYEWQLPDSLTQTATMTTPLAGGPPRRVEFVTRRDDDGTEVSTYTYDYTLLSEPVDFSDSSVFFRYRDLDCGQVSNFTAPDVCVDSWLNIEYECP